MDAKIRIERKKNYWWWTWVMAWRDGRRSRSKLLLFTSSIVLGIAALVAINSFRDNLLEDINDQAKELLGADLVIYSNQPVKEEILHGLDTAMVDKAFQTNFASMIYFPRTDGLRLVQVRALKGGYPYYGEIGTDPPEAAREFQSDRLALVDQTLMLQYDVVLGDSIRVGELSFKIIGKLQQVPGQSGISATVAPVVYIPQQYVEETGLVKKGSRINYLTYYKAASTEKAEEAIEAQKESLDEYELGYDTVNERKEQTGRAFTDLTRFLNLVAFIALLLGCVGVASAVHIYIKEKISVVAVLRCLGLKGKQAFYIYLGQIAVMGLIGSIVGAFLGTFIQTFLPIVFKDFLPLEVNMEPSIPAIVQGILIGVLISILFALISLLSVRNVSPLRTLRASYEEEADGPDRLKWVVYGLIFLFIFGFSMLQIRDLDESLYFTLGILGCFLILGGIGRLLIWLTRKFFPSSWSYVWRQGLANLFRPNNQTIVLVVSIGLGTALISTLYLVQELLVRQVDLSDSGERPNMVLFDIQTSQKDEIAEITRDYDLPVLQEVPIVTMRLKEINGYNKADVKADSTIEIPRWVYNREYRVTYRDSLIDSETLSEGRWIPTVESASDSIFISISQGFAENMNVEIGDELIFNVQGAIIKTYVGSFRKVDWNRVQTNFLVVFPEGVLENAPQFHVLITKVNSNDLSARYQQAIVRGYPNISIIDLTLILNTLDEILAKISFVIRFMAMFSILTGIIVLIGSVVISKFQRIQESVLLRTLGANQKQILGITALEYFFLGSIAAGSGIVLSLFGSWALAIFSFETFFTPNFGPIVTIFLVIAFLTMMIGMLNIRSVLSKTPLEVLRSEV